MKTILFILVLFCSLIVNGQEHIKSVDRQKTIMNSFPSYCEPPGMNYFISYKNFIDYQYAITLTKYFSEYKKDCYNDSVFVGYEYVISRHDNNIFVGTETRIIKYYTVCSISFKRGKLVNYWEKDWCNDINPDNFYEYTGYHYSSYSKIYMHRPVEDFDDFLNWVLENKKTNLWNK
jgi:hypothetical protein